MARALRANEPNGVYRVCSLGWNTAPSYGAPEDTLHTLERRGGEPRAAALHLCKRLTRVCLSDPDQAFGSIRASAVCNAVSALDRRLQRDKRRARLLSEIEKQLS